jgi:hypothetical protein
MQRSLMEGQPDLQETGQDGGADRCNHRDNDVAPPLPFPVEPKPPIDGQEDAAFQKLCIGHVVDQLIDNTVSARCLVDPEQDKSIPISNGSHLVHPPQTLHPATIACCDKRVKAIVQVLTGAGRAPRLPIVMVVTLLRQPLEDIRPETRWRTPGVEGRLLDRSDKALVAAFLLAAGLGTWTRCLMHDDGAAILSSGWFGSLWDLYASQIASRAAAVLAMHGPAWLARDAFDLDAGVYLTLAHVLYFAVPLVLWLVLRAVERDRLFSRLYLALALAMIYFPTELIFGVGLWLIWLALVRTRRARRRASCWPRCCWAPSWHSPIPRSP